MNEPMNANALAPLALAAVTFGTSWICMLLPDNDALGRNVARIMFVGGFLFLLILAWVIVRGLPVLP